MADEDTPDRVGVLVDERYKLLEMMASGAMGAVYKGERVPVGKIVAVKFLHASFANDSEFQARFERETRVMSKLAHPNCVSVLDFGVWENAPYLVMDYVAGQTLRARMDDGPIAPLQALAIARQIAAGLAHAHEQGVFHRDIKPANIMITDEIGHGERVRILDFGLARLRGNVGRDATQTNMVVGTPNYMAPEQTIPAGTIDARTDVYAVGVVLYEMVAGERPFAAEDTLQLLGMHRGAPIPRLADKLSIDLPAGLQQVIDKAMAKAPGDRYQNAIELADAIDDVIEGKVQPPIVVAAKKHNSGAVGIATTMLQVDSGRIEADEPPTRARFWRTMIAAMILVGGAAAMAGYLIHRNAEQSQSILKHDAAAVAAIEPEHADASTPDAAAMVAVSPDTGSGAGSGSDEIEMDPAVAEDLDPEAKGSAATAVEEADNAPKTTAEVETHEAVAEPPATTLAGAVQLIKDGKRDLALTSLRALRRKSPKSAYIPFLLGNLYFDQRWWSVSMDDYQDAIKKNAAYRTNPTINRNVIKMLGSSKTRSRATGFLRSTIGHPAGPYLKYAAVHEPNDVVRKQAASLARSVH